MRKRKTRLELIRSVATKMAALVDREVAELAHLAAEAEPIWRETIGADRASGEKVLAQLRAAKTAAEIDTAIEASFDWLNHDPFETTGQHPH